MSSQIHFMAEDGRLGGIHIHLTPDMGTACGMCFIYFILFVILLLLAAFTISFLFAKRKLEVSNQFMECFCFVFSFFQTFGDCKGARWQMWRWWGRHGTLMCVCIRDMRGCVRSEYYVRFRLVSLVPSIRSDAKRELKKWMEPNLCKSELQRMEIYICRCKTIAKP